MFEDSSFCQLFLLSKSVNVLVYEIHNLCSAKFVPGIQFRSVRERIETIYRFSYVTVDCTVDFLKAILRTLQQNCFHLAAKTHPG